MKFTALLNCEADPGELTVDQAHRCMQLHITCTVDNCLVRRRARRTLAIAGVVVLDAHTRLDR